MSNLRAALTLTFQDQVSRGMERLTRGLDDLKRAGRDVRLVGLDNADRTLRSAADGASFLGRSLGLVTASAERATGAIQRMGHAVRQFGSRHFGAGSAIGGVAAAASGYTMATQLEAWSRQSELLRTGSIISGNYGPDADRFMKEWGGYFNSLAKRSGQRSTALADTGAWMMFNGLSPDQIRTTLPGMAELATAYRADVKDVARVSEGLIFNLKVKPADITRALVVLAQLGKEGGFQFNDMAALFPKVASTGALVGMSGMGAVEELASAMQILLKAGSDREPGTAAVQLSEFLTKLDMEDTRKKFKENWNIDIRGILNTAALEGRSALDAGLAAVQVAQDREALKKRIRDPRVRAVSDGNVVKDLFGDKEARAGADILLKNAAELKRIMAVGAGVNVGMLDRDFGERARDDAVALDGLKERLDQTGRRVGRVFAPEVKRANSVLDDLDTKIEALDDKYPGLIDNTIRAGAGFLALGAGLAAIGLAAPLVSAGFGLLASPVGMVLGLLSGAAYYVISEWSTFGPAFEKIWDGTKRVMTGFAAWIVSTLKGDHVTARKALIEVWEGGKTLFEGAMEGWRKILGDLFGLLDGWTGGALTDAFKRITSAIDAAIGKVAALAEALKQLPNSMFSGTGESRATPNTPPEYVPPGGVPGVPGGGNILEFPFHRMSYPLGSGMGGMTTIYVRAEPGTVVTRIEGGQPGIQVNPGPTTVRI